MSSIDNRIVDMKFNNGQFQSGVASTLSALDKLKAGLKLDGAKKGLDDLDSASKKFSLAGIAAGVDTISSKFNALSAIGVGALANIGKKAFDVGQNMVRDMFIKNPAEGLKEYETKIGSIQTILANTAKHGTTLETVNKTLNDLNEYADKTIYSFGDMTRNIGLFTNAGLTVESATSMIKGFSNEAAASGTNAEGASRAAYQLSQALSSGKVTLMDWKSLTNVGMGNKNMQQGLIDIALGMNTFENATEDSKAAQQNFNASLETGWLNADVMSEYLRMMAGEMSTAEMQALGFSEEQVKFYTQQAKTAEDAATKVRSLTQLTGTMAEAAGSGWATTWEKIFGGFDEATELWTRVNNITSAWIGNAADARNAQLDIWRDNGGRDAFIEALFNIFDGVMSWIKPVKEAFAEIFPPSLGNTLTKISFALLKFSKGLKISAEGAERLKGGAKVVFAALKSGVGIIGAVLKYLVDTTGIVFDLAGAVIDVVAPIAQFAAAWVAAQFKVSSFNEIIARLADKIIEFRRSAIDPIIQRISAFGDSLDKALNKGEGFSGVGDDIRKNFEPLVRVADMFKTRWSSAVDWLRGTFSSAAENLKGDFKSLGDLINGIGGFVKSIGKSVANLFKSIFGGFEAVSGAVTFEQLLSGLNTAFLITMLVKLKKAFDPIDDVIAGWGDIKNGIVDALGGLNGVLGTMQKDIKANILLKIAAAIGILALSVMVLSLVDPERLIAATTAMGVAGGILMGAMAVFSKVSGMAGTLKLPVLAVGLMLLAASLLIMAIAVQKLSGIPYDQLEQGLTATVILLGAMTAAAILLSQFGGSIMGAAAGLVVMSIALMMVAGVALVLGSVPYEVIKQGLTSVMILLGGLVLAAILMNQFAPNMLLSAIGLMAMAGALMMLVAPLVTLGLLPMDVLVQGLATLGILLGGLVVAGLLIAAVGPGMLAASLGLAAMAFALNLMVAPLITLGSIPWQVLVQGIIGLAVVLGVLVVAALAMSGAAVGAAGMVAMAAAVLILAAALRVIAGLGLAGIGVAIMGLVATFAVMGGAALLLGPLTPVLMALAGALAVFGLGLIAIALSTVIFSMGLLMLAPALMAAVVSLKMFAGVAPQIAEAVPAFMAIGAGLLVFGLGAAVAGAGIMILGLGIMALGLGLAIVAVSGVVGATALVAVGQALSKMVKYAIPLGIMAGVFVALGAGVLVLGAGLLILGAGIIVAAAGILMLVLAGAVLPPIINAMGTSFKKLIPMEPGIKKVGGSLTKLADAVVTIGTSANRASGSLVTMVSNLNSVAMMVAILAAAVKQANTDVNLALLMMVMSMTLNMTMMTTQMTIGQTKVQSIGDKIVQSVDKMASGIQKSGIKAQTAARAAVSGVQVALSSGLNRIAGSVDNQAQAVGTAMTTGMVRGLQNGSARVSAAARTVATRALAASKAALGVASPSKEFEKVGVWSDDGLERGFLKNADGPVGAAMSIAAATVDAFKTAFEAINQMSIDEINDPVIRPVVDMRGARASLAGLNVPLGDVGRLDISASRLAAQSAYIPDRQSYDTAVAVDDRRPAQTVFNQYNNSPKALSPTEVYRNTKNLLSTFRRGEQ